MESSDSPEPDRMTLRPASFLCLLLLSLPVCGSQVDELIEHARELSINATPEEAQAALEDLESRLDPTAPRQQIEFRLIAARVQALNGDYLTGAGMLASLLDRDIDPDHRLRALELAANMLLQVGHYHDAFQYLNDAIETTSRVDAPDYQARAFSLASYWYTEVGAVEEGMHFADRAAALIRNTSDSWAQCVTLEKLALAHWSAGSLDTARQTAARALEACDDAGDLLFSGSLMVLLGQLDHQLGNLEQAEHWLTEGMAATAEAGYIDGLMTGTIQYGRLLVELERHEQARRILGDAVERIESRQRWRTLADGHYLLARIATSAGNLAEAYEHFQRHLDAHERFLDSQRTRLIAFHEVRFNAEAKERELALLREQARVDALEEQSRKQEVMLQSIGYGVIGVLVVVLALLLFHAARERRHYRLLSRRDSLTGLHNHTRFFESAAKALAKAQLNGEALTLILADIDHFKKINDRYGHLTGDEALRKVAARLREAFGDAGLIGRIGGEEFGMMLTGEDAASANRRIQELRKRMQESRSDDVTTPITMSFGVAVLDQEHSIAELRQKADEALYRAKRAGRDRAVTAGMQEVQDD